MYKNEHCFAMSREWNMQRILRIYGSKVAHGVPTSKLYIAHVIRLEGLCSNRHSWSTWSIQHRVR